MIRPPRYARVPMDKRLGQRLGDWTVIGPGIKRRARRLMLCRCRCGSTAHVHWDMLLHGTSTCCVQCRLAKRTAKAAARYAKLGLTGIASDGHGGWQHPCVDCGKMVSVPSLRCGKCHTARFRKYPRTLAAVGKKYGVTRQRIHQLVGRWGWKAALKRLAARPGAHQ